MEKRKKNVKRKQVTYRRISLWKVQRKDRKIPYGREGKEEEVEKKGRKSNRRPRARQTLEKSGRWLFLFLLFGRNWLCVDAAAEGLQRRTEMTEKVVAAGSEHVEAGARRRSGGAEYHYRVECGQRHQSGLLKQMEKMPRKWS